MKAAEKLRQAFAGLGFASRMRQGRRGVVRHLRRPHGDSLPMPTFLQLRLTNLCNLRCRMCGQWGDTGVYRDGSRPVRQRLGLDHQLTLDEYARLLDEVAPSRPIVSLFGGEPMLYPEVLPLLREVKRRGLTLTMISNGTLLARHAEALVDAGIDGVAVSLDGHPELHDRIRGRSGSFAVAAGGVRALAEARTRRGRARPVLMALLPITELNLEEVAPAVDALLGLPLDLVSVGLRWYVPPAAGAAYEETLQRDLGVPAGSWKGFEFGWPEAEAASPRMKELVRVLRSLRRRRFAEAARWRPWVTFMPELRPEQVPVYLTRHAETFGHELCPAPWYFAQVQPDGDVAFCGDFPDYPIGNLRRESFAGLWGGPRARAFRDRLRRGPLPVCSRCCGSFVYGRWSRQGIAPAER